MLAPNQWTIAHISDNYKIDKTYPYNVLCYEFQVPMCHVVLLPTYVPT